MTLTGRPQTEPAMFDCTLGEYARRLEPTTEADPAGIFATLVSATSAMVGPSPRVQIGDARHPLTVWTLLCGRTAAGRKGTAEAVARRVLAEADPVFFRENILSGLSSAEGLIAAVADDDADGRPIPDGAKRRLVVEPEFGVVLARAKREGNALVQVMREAWDGRDLRVQTKVPLVASAPHLAVNGHISPEEFRARVSSRDLAGGSYNRFMIVYVERSKRLPDGGGAAEDDVLSMGRDLRSRLATARQIGLVRRDVAAADCWRQLYDELVDLEDDPVLSDWVARAVPYTMRVASLYAVLDGRTTVLEPHLMAAASFVRYAMDSIRYVVQAGDGAPRDDAAFVAKLIRESGQEGIGRAQLTKTFGARGDAASLDAALKRLLEQPGFATREFKTAGRPGRLYRYVAPAGQAEGVHSSSRRKLEPASGELAS